MFCSSYSAIDLVQGLLRVNPLERLAVNDIFSHPWINAHIVTLNKLYDNVLKKTRLSEATPFYGREKCK